MNTLTQPGLVATIALVWSICFPLNAHSTGTIATASIQQKTGATKAPFVLPPLKLDRDSQILTSDSVIYLTNVDFDGNHVFSHQELKQLASSYIGRPLSASDFEDLRLSISNFYVNKGYINSGATLADQDVSDGEVKFQITEGKLKKIIVAGNGWLSQSYISDRLILDEDEVLNTNELREKFQLLLQDPLIERLNGELKPGERLGEAILDLDVTRSQPYGLSLTTDNYRPPSSGAYELVIDGYVRNLTTFGDKLMLRGELSEGAWNIQGLIDGPVNRWDTRLWFAFEESDSSVIEESLEVIDIESNYSSYEGGITHPFIKTLSREFLLGASLGWRKSKTWLLDEPFPFSPGVDENGTASTSAIRLMQEFIDRAPHQAIALRSTFGIGVSLFGSTTNSDKPDSKFLTWVGQGIYSYRFDNLDTILQLRTDMQLASERLLPMEKFALGGRYSVRGYRENELVRDNGVTLSAEIRHTIYGNPANPDHLSIQLIPFVDSGLGWNFNETADSETLISAGVGIMASWKDIFAEFFYAYAIEEPIDKQDYDLQDSGIHFRLTWSLL